MNSISIPLSHEPAVFRDLAIGVVHPPVCIFSESTADPLPPHFAFRVELAYDRRVLYTGCVPVEGAIMYSTPSISQADSVQLSVRIESKPQDSQDVHVVAKEATLHWRNKRERLGESVLFEDDVRVAGHVAEIVFGPLVFVLWKAMGA
jgi:hypothetical protein